MRWGPPSEHLPLVLALWRRYGSDKSRRKTEAVRVSQLCIPCRPLDDICTTNKAYLTVFIASARIL